MRMSIYYVAKFLGHRVILEKKLKTTKIYQMLLFRIMGMFISIGIVLFWISV